MKRSRFQQLIRQFPENGMKLMMHDPRNVEEVLTVAAAEIAEMIDFSRMQLIKTSFVKRDYRHIESDVVLTAPLRDSTPGRSRRRVIVYILIEHQSQPDPLMPLRILDYVVQIFHHQLREQSTAKLSLRGVRLQPVLPLVFYTGTRRWDSPGKLADLVEMSQVFEDRLPNINRFFLSLRDTPARTLESGDGFFRWVLRLVQQRKSGEPQFRRLLRRVVQRLEAMPPEQRLRWLELLSYVHALVYHERHANEIPSLQEAIETSVQTDEHRREVFQMGKSYAEALIEQGREEGREEGREQGRVSALQQTLLRLLDNRFGELPKSIVDSISSTNDVEQLDEWLNRIASATSLDEIGID